MYYILNYKHPAHRAALLVAELTPPIFSQISTYYGIDKHDFSAEEIGQVIKESTDIPDNLKGSVMGVVGSQLTYPEIQNLQSWNRFCAVL